MKIIRHDNLCLELSGIPGGAAAIAVPVGLMVLGALMMFFWAATGSVVPLVAGGAMALGGLSVGLHAWTRRERLRFDLRARSARHEVRSLLGGSSASLEFTFDRIDSVSLERSMVRTPGRRTSAGTEAWTARLRLVRPRRALVLVETQGGSESSVRAIAEQVARSLGVPLADLAGDELELAAPAEIGKSIGARELGDISLAPPPAGARLGATILPGIFTVRLEWRTIGGPALPMLGLVCVGFFATLSTAMALEATGLIPVLSWTFGSSSRARQAAQPPILAALLAMSLATWTGCALILHTWLWSRRRLEITPEHTRLLACSPLARAAEVLGLRWFRVRWSVRTSAIRSIRTHEDVIEVRIAEHTRRAWVHLAAPGEAAWAARVLRTAVSALAAPGDRPAKGQ